MSLPRKSRNFLIALYTITFGSWIAVGSAPGVCATYVGSNAQAALASLPFDVDDAPFESTVRREYLRTTVELEPKEPTGPRLRVVLHHGPVFAELPAFEPFTPPPYGLGVLDVAVVGRDGEAIVLRHHIPFTGDARGAFQFGGSMMGVSGETASSRDLRTGSAELVLPDSSLLAAVVSEASITYEPGHATATLGIGAFPTRFEGEISDLLLTFDARRTGSGTAYAVHTEVGHLTHREADLVQGFDANITVAASRAPRRSARWTGTATAIHLDDAILRRARFDVQLGAFDARALTALIEAIEASQAPLLRAMGDASRFELPSGTIRTALGRVLDAHPTLDLDLEGDMDGTDATVPYGLHLEARTSEQRPVLADLDAVRRAFRLRMRVETNDVGLAIRLRHPDTIADLLGCEFPPALRMLNATESTELASALVEHEVLARRDGKVVMHFETDATGRFRGVELGGDPSLRPAICAEVASELAPDVPLNLRSFTFSGGSPLAAANAFAARAEELRRCMKDPSVPAPQGTGRATLSVAVDGGVHQASVTLEGRFGAASAECLEDTLRTLRIEGTHSGGQAQIAFDFGMPRTALPGSLSAPSGDPEAAWVPIEDDESF